MIEISSAIWICIGFVVYYSILQIFSDFIRAGMACNTPNSIIEELRIEYGVNIRTFQKNNNLNGFAWFNSVWINESLFKREKSLLFTFHHEYYHLKHNHKAWILFMRFTITLIPLLFAFIHWGFVLLILFSYALVVERISEKFEDKANAYAKTMI